jgi:hypothetical protein
MMNGRILLKLLVGVVPEDDALPFFVEEALQCGADLVQGRSFVVLPARNGLGLGQEVAELAVVHLHAVIEVER